MGMLKRFVAASKSKPRKSPSGGLSPAQLKAQPRPLSGSGSRADRAFEAALRKPDPSMKGPPGVSGSTLSSLRGGSRRDSLLRRYYKNVAKNR